MTARITGSLAASHYQPEPRNIPENEQTSTTPRRKPEISHFYNHLKLEVQMIILFKTQVLRGGGGRSLNSSIGYHPDLSAMENFYFLEDWR
jgi:hypothetical protein